VIVAFQFLTCAFWCLSDFEDIMSIDKSDCEPIYDLTSDSETQDDDVDQRVTVDTSDLIAIDVRGILDRGSVRVAEKDEIDDPVENVEVVEASTSGRSGGVLTNSPASLVTSDHLHYLRAIYGIPRSVELRAPLSNKRADWDIPGWTCFYEYIIRLGFRFPIPPLARRLLVYYDIAPGQLMPNSWRILLSLTVLCEKYNIELNLGCLLHNYYLKEHVKDEGRYLLILRSNKFKLITETTSNDQNWKDTFFFAKGPPVDGPWGSPKYLYRCTWNREGERRSHTSRLLSFIFILVCNHELSV